MRETYGREVYYDIPDPKLKQATQWLISNPNRVNLGRIGLKYKGKSLDKSLIKSSKQELDLWNGIITSTFEVDGKSVKVVTQADFESDAVAFSLDSDLLQNGDLKVELDFPYPPIHSTAYKYEVSSNILQRIRTRRLNIHSGFRRCVRFPPKSHNNTSRGWDRSHVRSYSARYARVAILHQPAMGKRYSFAA